MRSAHAQQTYTRSKGSNFCWQIAGVIGEILISFAIVCALYIAWQMWWTGAQVEHNQIETRQETSWQNPKTGNNAKIAMPQNGEPPKADKPTNDGLIARMYIPRFGNQWERNVIEGITPYILSKRGLGHYTETQMPGEIGNFAVAGHRNGYGQPLGDVDLLKPGDPIIVRTKDYWFVYKYTSYKIVTPEHIEVIAPNPDHPKEKPVKRMLTLTTCEPKYTAATHRWISYAEFSYWAKISDGIPKELSTIDEQGKVKFINNEQQSLVSHLSSLTPVMAIVAALYIIIFAAGAIAWQWPELRAIHAGIKSRPDASIFGFILRLQPGVAPIRWILALLIYFFIILALFQWVFPWGAATIPLLQQMSNYTTTV